MADQSKPESAYPSTAEWLADLDHSLCRQDRAGTCHDIHCVHCGKNIGSGWVPCSCREAAPR